MDSKPFGVQLQELITRAGLNQRRFAQAIDVDPTYINRVIKGSVQRPEPEMIAKMAAALDVPYEELLGMAGYPRVGEPAPPRLLHVVDNGDEAIDPAVIVAYVESRPGEKFRRQVRAVKARLSPDKYQAWCVSLFRAWASNSRAVLESFELAE